MVIVRNSVTGYTLALCWFLLAVTSSAINDLQSIF